MKTFFKGIPVSVWSARWWIVAAAVLCLVDQTLRTIAFCPELSRKAVLHSAKLFLFYVSLAVAPVFLLGRFACFAAPVLFAGWFLAEAVQLWVLCSFNMTLGGNWVLMAFSTSGAEVREFVSGFLTPFNAAYALLAVVSAAVIALFFASGRRVFPVLSPSSASLALLCASLACPLARSSFRAPVSWAQISRDLLALNFPVDTISNWRAYRALGDSCRREPSMDLSVADGGGKPRLAVFVIGESTTRSHMGIYGYRRDTTPELAAISAGGGLTVFTDLTTTHSTTPEALCSLLTGTDLAAGRPIPAVFPAMLKKAGYRTVLISCQGSWQNKDVVGSHLFLSCDSRRFLQGNRVAGTLPDGIALPKLEEELGGMTGDLAVFVHLYGCHNPAARRVPEGFSRQWPPMSSVSSKRAVRKVDSYDTAVAYDDHVVAAIIRMASRCGVPACVFCVSDHGESPDSAIWRDARSRDTFEVPLLVWLSPEYRAAYPDTAARVEEARSRCLRMDQLLEGMLELARVEGYRPWDSDGNFLSARFREIPPTERRE